MKIAILGYGLQGQSAYEYWAARNHELTICDSNPETIAPPGISTQLGDNYLHDLSRFDLLVRTPVLHPRDIVAANPDNPHILDKVTSVTNEFFAVCPTKNIIGVTGTKGKGTTSTLIARMLETAGKRVHLGGNIGIPPLELLKNDIKPDDWVVLELANFQLVDIKYSPPVAVCLMVVSEHQDWHHGMPEYMQAKQQLFRFQHQDDRVVYNHQNESSRQIIEISPAEKIGYEVPAQGREPQDKNGVYVESETIFVAGIMVCPVDRIALLGRHNIENVCAAIGAVWNIIGHDTTVVEKVVSSFTGLEHRLEKVREFGGVSYYDDSFGTTPETAMVAIQAFSQPKVVILGGSSKGASYDELAHVIVTNNVRKAVLIGDTAPDIQKALETAGFTDTVAGGDSMTEIVATATKQAQSGDIVLLSTACASFDMFTNYKDRGTQFQNAVADLT